MPNIPDYMRVRQYVIDLVLNHADSDARLMSERELCKAFDVARTTVRKALKDLIDDKIIYVQHGKGMFINAAYGRNNASRQQRFYKIAVICDNGKSVYFDGFTMGVLAQLFNRLKGLPVHLIIMNLMGENGDTLKEIEMYNPDAMIWLRPPENGLHVVEELSKRIPVCIVGSLPGDSSFAVTMDYRKAGRLAASWFIERGLKRVAFVGSSHSPRNIRTELFGGWQDEFLARSMEYDAKLGVDVSSDIVTSVKELLSEGIDGIFTFGSEFAAVDNAMNESGRSCPVMLDENYFALHGASHAPAALLIIFPETIAQQAADQIFKSLTCAGFLHGETVVEPSIRMP